MGSDGVRPSGRKRGGNKGCVQIGLARVAERRRVAQVHLKSGGIDCNVLPTVELFQSEPCRRVDPQRASPQIPLQADGSAERVAAGIESPRCRAWKRSVEIVRDGPRWEWAR